MNKIAAIASMVIISLCFFVVIFLIFSDKLNRAVASLTAAVVTYFVLIFIEGKDFSVIVDLLFGTPIDGFVNLHSLILILGMMFIVQISAEVGLFQFLGILAIKVSKGKPIALMSILCTISVLFSAVINNILTVMIMVPLTITISRILKIDPTPYILTEAILVNIGGTFFSISSIPNILITTSAEITFAEYFLNVGLFSLAIAGITIVFFIFMYRKDFSAPRKMLSETLDEFNVWNFVQSRRLLYASMASIGVLMIGFILIGPVIPATAVPPDIFAFTIAMILTIFSAILGLKPKEIIKSFDLELILYLLGIFVLAGGLEEVGVVDAIGVLLAGLGSGNPTFQIILLIWISAFLSSLIDNIPITKVLIPIVNIMTTEALIPSRYFYALSMGANWGDNLTPLGDNILVLNIAEQNNRPIKMKTFWKLGFVTTLLQLYLGTAYFTFFSIDTYYIGLIMIFAVLLTVGILFIISNFGTEKAKSNISRGINKFRSMIIS